MHQLARLAWEAAARRISVREGLPGVSEPEKPEKSEYKHQYFGDCLGSEATVVRCSRGGEVEGANVGFAAMPRSAKMKCPRGEMPKNPLQHRSAISQSVDDTTPLAEEAWRMRAVVEAMAEAVFFVDPISLALIDANSAACRTLGYAPEELCRFDVFDICEGLEASTFRETVNNLLGDGVLGDTVLNGTTQYESGGRMHLRVKQRDRQRISRAVVWDVCRRKHRDADVVIVIARPDEAPPTFGNWAGNDRQLLAALATSDGLWDWDIVANRVFYSARWNATLGRAGGDSIDKMARWFELVHPRDLTGLKSRLKQHLAGPQTDFEHEHRLRHVDGTYRWVRVRATTVRNAQGIATRMVGSKVDISCCKQHDAMLSVGWGHDPLTQLPDRRLLQRRLQRAVEYVACRVDYTFALLFVDLDHFKQVNDSVGHLAGDRLLCAVANRLCSCVRPGDMVARFGGDEFVVLLDHTQGTDAMRVAERIQTAMNRPVELDDFKMAVTASIGVALSSSNPGVDGHISAEQLIAEADRAMYEAKKRGRARSILFDNAWAKRERGVPAGVGPPRRPR